MKITELITYTFSKNVGTADRIFRVLSGLGLAVAPWLMNIQMTLQIPIAIFGVAWFLTGVTRRCGMYHMLGVSTLKKGGK